MARISQYDQDSTINKLDKVVGTDSATGTTKNYSIDSMISLVNSEGLVEAFDGVSYSFKSYEAGSTAPKGIINLNAGSATNAAFSAINQIYISVLDKHGKSLSNYLDDTINSFIRIVQKTDLNTYGVFEVTAVANHDSGAYKLLTVTPRINNGNIVVNEEYFAYNFSAIFDQDFSDDSVEEFGDVTSAGSGQIITSTERTNLTDLQANALLHADVVDNVTSTATTVPLSAAQGKVLKDLIDGLTSLLDVDAADKPALDTLREVVNFCQVNAATLSALGISTIPGLQTALDAKQSTQVGKGLSTNDFTTALLNKLNGIAANAEVNIPHDYDTLSNKPTDVTVLSNHSVTDLSDVTSTGSGAIISSAERDKIDSTHGTFIGLSTAERTKLSNIEAGADVTDSANVTAAGALMDSEVTNLSQIKAFDSTDYATSAQGAKADSAQQPPSEGAFVNGDKTKLDNIESNADVTDTTNVTAAGALMDSEVTNLAQVKAFSAADYATAAQGTKADSAQQPPAEGAFADGDKTKLDGIESNADVTDTTNVTAAGALMDSELANLTAVKAINQGLATTDNVQFNNITQQGHRSIKHSDAVKTLIVKVVTKTVDHPEYGNGSSSGYTIDDIEGAYLEFTPGNTYKFDQSDSSNSGHPFRFYEDAAKTTAYTTGVTTNGTPGGSGAYTQIIPTTDTPPILFYQCSAHGLMGSYVKFGTGTIGDTYAINVTQDGNNVDLKLDANSGTDSTVQLTAGSNITLTRNDAQQVTIASTASGGITGVTVQEEGSPLSTAATTLNFTGTAVTASGAGATKTINVAGGAITVQEEGSDLSTAATTLNFTGTGVTASGSGAVKTINVTGGGSSGGTVTIEKNVYTGDSSDVTFDTSTAIANENNVQVYIDGVYQSKDNYTTSGSTVTMSAAPGTGASVELIHMVSTSGVIARDSFTGNGSATAYVLSMSISNENATQVYLDGVYQSKDNYSTSGSTLTFSTSPPNGTAIEVVHIKAVNASSLNQNNFTGNGSTTAFTLSQSIDDEAKTFVFIQGVYQEKSTYSISGTTLTFTTAPQNGYTIEVMAFSTISVGNQGVTSLNGQTGAVTLSTGIDWQSTIQTADFTAVAEKGYFVNTASGAVTVTLPSSPALGDTVAISDYGGSAATNNITIESPNNIQGSSINKLLNKNNNSVELVYSDSTKGWIISSDSNNALVDDIVVVNYLVIAGGGSGGDGDMAGSGGGGGAGGYRASYNNEPSGGGGSSETELNLLLSTNYTVTVGAGGAAASGAGGNNGSDSVFHTITSIGGGGGARANQAGSNGGSGGGGGAQNAGSGTANQGYDGGGGYHAGPYYPNGGGGGAGAAGDTASSGSVSSRNGGAGVASTITGSSVTRGGGGAMGRYNTSSSGGSGGSGGGGNSAQAGGANLGGGGGGTSTGSSSGAGGSGVVILRYASSKTLTNPGGGLTLSTATVSSDKVTTITAGTGNIQFN